jgi:hypothetical protein
MEADASELLPHGADHEFGIHHAVILPAQQVPGWKYENCATPFAK